MIRFRHTDDERRYNLIRSDIYTRVASGALPATIVSEILQSLSKIETMLHLEGMRQGLAVALLTEASAKPRMKAYQQHAIIYGSADTPLIDVEKDVAAEANIDLRHPWLDPAPMRFAPKPFGQNPPPILRVAGAVPDALPEAPRVPTTLPAPQNEEEEQDNLDNNDLDEIAKMLDMPREMLDRLMEKRNDAGELPPGAAPSPDLLDRIRETLKTKLSSGWKPDSYQDIILMLHVDMQTDARALDVNLATHEGRTVLDQVGLLEIQIPVEVDVRFFDRFDELPPKS